MIGGVDLLGEDGKKRYAKLGKRESIFPEDKRDSIYDFFKEYKEFIEKDSEYYDPSLIAHECTGEEIYDAVVVDEVQDLTKSILSLILKSLKDESKGNFLLCGDVNQVIHPSFFSLSKLKSFLKKNTADKELSVCFLEKNYRNSQQVIELANRVLHLKNYCFASEDKITAGGKEAFFMSSDTENMGNVSFIAGSKKEEIVKEVSKSINWAVLVLDDESKKDACELFDTPLVFNIHEAKGLEFKNVILYKFMFCKAYNGIWNTVCSNKDKERTQKIINKIRRFYDEKDVNTSRSKNKEDKSFEEFKFYMNALYVGVSRTIDSACIMDNEKEHNLLKVIKPKKMVSVDIKKEESSPEEWKNMALKLIDQGNIEQSENIVKDLLHKGEKEYAEEVINALKAKGYGVSRINAGFQEKHSQKQGRPKLHQLEQEIEKSNSNELKNDAENTSSQSSQERSTGDKVLTKKTRKHKSKKLQDEKHKQNPNEEKKSEGLKKDEKEKIQRSYFQL